MEVQLCEEGEDNRAKAERESVSGTGTEVSLWVLGLSWDEERLRRRDETFELTYFALAFPRSTPLHRLC